MDIKTKQTISNAKKTILIGAVMTTYCYLQSKIFVMGLSLKTGIFYTLKAKQSLFYFMWGV